MSINLYALNSAEAALIKSDTKSTAYRINADKIKENWEEIKSSGKNLFQSSETVSYESGIVVEEINTGEVNRNYCNYSMDVFFQKNMPQISTDGSYMVGGVSFSREELEQCRMVMKAAVDGIGCGIGKSTNIDYKNYAQMGIAISCVKTYASENLTEEQAAVVNRAMDEYKEALVNMEKELMSGSDYKNSNYEGLSEYYGKVRVLSDVEINAINKLKEELTKLTGRYYEPTVSGEAACVQTATNEGLTGTIMDLFSGLDFTDERSIDMAMEEYRELMLPVYTAYGMNDTHGSLSGILKDDTDSFKKQISDILMAARYHTADYSI